MERANALLRSPETDWLMSRPLRILLDGRMLLGRFSGVARVVTRLAEGLASREDIEVFVLCGQEDYEPWRDRSDIQRVRTDFTRGDRSPGKRYRWENRSLGKWIREIGPDLYHATWNSGIPTRCTFPTVLTVHDLIPWHHPVTTWQSLKDRYGYRRSVALSIKRANMVITVSDYVRDQVVGTLATSPDKIITVHNGVDQPIEIEEKPIGRANPYVLYVGGYEPRKNLAALFSTMTCYWQQFGREISLYLVGHADRLSGEALKAFDLCPAEAPIRFLGDIDDQALGQTYRSASALLMLSTEEGFGLPVLEAMAHGCPVLAARCSSLPEVVGDAGVLVDPQDTHGIAQTLHRILTDANHRQGLCRRGLDRAGHFSWELAIDKMVAVYHRMLHEASAQNYPPALATMNSWLTQ